LFSNTDNMTSGGASIPIRASLRKGQ